MLLEPTFEKLNALKLQGMIKGLQEQLQNPEVRNLSFEERIGMLVEMQYEWKENRKINNRLKRAGMRINASAEDIDYQTPRGIQKANLAPLFMSHWIETGQNCILTGPTGSGKTHIACAIGQKACRNGYRVLYFYLPKLYRKIEESTADGTLNLFLNQLSKTDLIILDDWGLETPKEQLLKDILEILDDRHEKGSTLITSQYPLKHWHDALGNPTLADAILDRLIHNCHKIELQTNDSMRKLKTKTKGGTHEKETQHQKKKS